MLSLSSREPSPQIPPEPAVVPTLAVMEVLSESELDEESSSELNPVMQKLKADSGPSIVSLVSPVSPSCESQSLLPDYAGKRGSRKKIY